MHDLASYQQAYRNIRFERADGLLQMQIHHSGAGAVWTAEPGGIHEQIGDAFYRIGYDPENRVIIITGTGNEFLARMDVAAVLSANGQTTDHRISAFAALQTCRLASNLRRGPHSTKLG